MRYSALFRVASLKQRGFISKSLQDDYSKVNSPFNMRPFAASRILSCLCDTHVGMWAAVRGAYQILRWLCIQWLFQTEHGSQPCPL